MIDPFSNLTTIALRVAVYLHIQSQQNITMTKRKLSEPDAEPPRRSTRLRTTTQASSAGADQSRHDPAKEAFKSKPKAAAAAPKKAAKKRSKGDDSVSSPPKNKSEKI